MARESRPRLLERRLTGRRRDDPQGFFLDQSVAPRFPGADDPESSRTDFGVANQRETTYLFPAEPLDLERIHPDFRSRERTGAVVLVDRLGDRLQIARLGPGHLRSITDRSSAGVTSPGDELRTKDCARPDKHHRRRYRRELPEDHRGSVGSSRPGSLTRGLSRALHSGLPR